MMNLTLADIQSQINVGELTLEQLVSEYLLQIEATKHLNIYVEVWADEAIQQARQLDKKRLSGEDVGKLHGVVISIKDVICYADHYVSAASKSLQGYKSPYTATVLQRALDEDAIVIGRTNCDEFAMGSSNENSIYGPTINGYGQDLVPGGSSGAAAVSVQMDTCLLALGSDTGGSVRQPAAFCGVYGMKPTYGWLSRYGLIAYASSFDQIGFLSKDPQLLSVALETMAGRDPMDSTSIDIPQGQSKVSKSKSLRIAYFSSLLDHDALSADYKELISQKIKQHKDAGHQVDSVEFDLIDFLIPCYYILTTAEASSNLNRYDGIRYGYSTSDPKDIEEMIINSRSEGFGEEVKRRIMMGTFSMSVGYFDAYFAKAQKARQMIKVAISNILNKYDLILMPTAIDHPWKIGNKNLDPVSIYLSDVYTVIANLCGLPAISVPIHQEGGALPIGVQYMTKANQDYFLLNSLQQI